MNPTYACLALGLGWNELKTLHWALWRPEVYAGAIRALLQERGWIQAVVPEFRGFVLQPWRQHEALAAPTQNVWCAIQCDDYLAVYVLTKDGPYTMQSTLDIAFASGAYPTLQHCVKSRTYTRPCQLLADCMTAVLRGYLSITDLSITD